VAHDSEGTLIEYIQDVHSVGGSVTINLAIRQEPSLPPGVREIIKEVGSEVR